MCGCSCVCVFVGITMDVFACACVFTEAEEYELFCFIKKHEMALAKLNRFLCVCVAYTHVVVDGISVKVFSPFSLFCSCCCQYILNSIQIILRLLIGPTKAS